MKIKFFSVGFFLLVVPFFGFSQELPTSGFEKKTGTNQIFIQQIGENNQIRSHVQSSQAMLRLEQNGMHNYAQLHLKAENIRENISQMGDYNRVFDFAYDGTQEFSLDLKQQGNTNHFERYGSNSIGNNLKFEMNGDSKMIIVRNYK